MIQAEVYIVGVHERAKLRKPLDDWSSYIRDDMACEPQAQKQMVRRHTTNEKLVRWQLIRSCWMMLRWRCRLKWRDAGQHPARAVELFVSILGIYLMHPDAHFAPDRGLETYQLEYGRTLCIFFKRCPCFADLLVCFTATGLLF